jgi:hypothetical protein
MWVDEGRVLATSIRIDLLKVARLTANGTSWTHAEVGRVTVGVPQRHIQFRGSCHMTRLGPVGKWVDAPQHHGIGLFLVMSSY